MCSFHINKIIDFGRVFVSWLSLLRLWQVRFLENIVIMARVSCHTSPLDIDYSKSIAWSMELLNKNLTFCVSHKKLFVTSNFHMLIKFSNKQMNPQKQGGYATTQNPYCLGVQIFLIYIVQIFFIYILFIFIYKNFENWNNKELVCQVDRVDVSKAVSQSRNMAGGAKVPFPSRLPISQVEEHKATVFLLIGSTKTEPVVCVGFKKEN